MAIIAALVILLVAAPAARAADIVIGGSNGWTNFGVDYDTWSAGQKFKVGDNAVFNYGGSHSVAEVSSSDYNSCDASNAIQTHNDGATKIPLTTAGTKYFICTAAGHCSSGMKVSIKVDAASSGGSPSTPTPTTPSGSGSGSTTPEPSTPSSSSGGSNKKEPSYNTGAATSAALYNMLFGSAAVIGTTMVALLG